MKRFYIFLLPSMVLSLALTGCATVGTIGTAADVTGKIEPMVTDQDKLVEVKPEVEQADEKPEVKDASPVLENVNEDQIDKYSMKKGVIFAKTDFQGVLKKSYVKFLFQEQEDLSHKFQLLIGNKMQDNVFPWDIKTVEPGYFFVELPVGNYKITSISIPVGSTIATEKIDIAVTVKEKAITYIGTLKLVGTKDKIKLGGVPVIQPGFEYLPEILDQRDEAFQIFYQRYPKFAGEIGIDLMKIGNMNQENL